MTLYECVHFGGELQTVLLMLFHHGNARVLCIELMLCLCFSELNFYASTFPKFFLRSFVMTAQH